MTFKKSCAIAVAIAAICSAAFSQPVVSDLANASVGTFTNAIDWTYGPNEKFNTLKSDYILGGLDFTGGGIGYYKSGAMPLSIKADLDASKSTSPTSSEQIAPGGTTTYKHPIFNNFAFNVNATVGIPSINDLSIGLFLQTTQDDDGSETTTPVGTTTTVVNKSGNATIGIPFGMKLGNGYNYAEVNFYTSWTKNATQDQSFSRLTLYDKYRFASILPGGTWTAVEGTIGVPSKSNYAADTTTYCAVGVLNRFDIKVTDGVNLALIPKVSLQETGYFNNPVGSTYSRFTTLLTFDVKMGVNATIPGTPISVTAGISPSATINLVGSSATAGGVTLKTFDNTIGYGATSNALFCLTVAFPEDVSMNLEVINANSYSFECVIPLKPLPAAAPKASAAPAAKEEKPAAQPAPKTSAKPADKAAAKKN